MDPIRKSYADTPFGQVHLRSVAGPSPPLVLLHRTPMSSASFDAVLRILAENRAAIALDTPGFGASIHPAGFPSAPDYGGFLLTALDGHGIDQFHLFGHHTGTHFAVEMAVSAPERVLSLGLSGVLYADAAERAVMRREIGNALPVNDDGLYVEVTWSLIKNLFKPFDANLVHAEFLGALATPNARDQAFNAILNQDFAAILDRVACPIKILQAADDPLGSFLSRVHAAHPEIAIEKLGPAGIAAPELQPVAVASALIAFTARARDYLI